MYEPPPPPSSSGRAPAAGPAQRRPADRAARAWRRPPTDPITERVAWAPTSNEAPVYAPAPAVPAAAGPAAASSSRSADAQRRSVGPGFVLERGPRVRPARVRGHVPRRPGVGWQPHHAVQRVGGHAGRRELHPGSRRAPPAPRGHGRHVRAGRRRPGQRRGHLQERQPGGRHDRRRRRHRHGPDDRPDRHRDRDRLGRHLRRERADPDQPSRRRREPLQAHRQSQGRPLPSGHHLRHRHPDRPGHRQGRRDGPADGPHRRLVDDPGRPAGDRHRQPARDVHRLGDERHHLGHRP